VRPRSTINGLATELQAFVPSMLAKGEPEMRCSRNMLPIGGSPGAAQLGGGSEATAPPVRVLQ